MKWKNIRALLRLAVVNNRLTEQQAKFLEKEFCREWNITEILNFYDNLPLIVIFIVKNRKLWYKLHK